MLRNFLLGLSIFQLLAGSVALADTLAERLQKRISAVQPILISQNYAHFRQGNTNECLHRYDRFYNDNELNIALAIGYNDARPYDAVEDITIDNAVSGMLVSACAKGQMVCGFRQVPAPDKVSKMFVKAIYGPDHKVRVLRIKLFHASLEADDDKNRVNPNQVIRSNLIEANFKAALQKSDVVLYMGHSRDGGGPDFDPPKLLANNHVDYDWYHKHKTDFQELLSDISQTSTPPKLLGLLSCYSNMHFASPIKRVSPETGLLVSLNEIGDGQIFEGLMTVLNGIQRFKCETQLSSDLEAVNIDKTKVGGRQKSLLEFRNFPVN